MLIVGAGPTGLVLALWLTKSGVRVRIVDKTDAPGTTSRALVVHARNLEFYHQLGIADEARKDGLEFAAANLWVEGKEVARLPFGDLGATLSPYPYILVFPQDQHEQMLVQQLDELGVHVERATELLSFEETANGVRAHLRRVGGDEELCDATYLAGCDGARSTVRQALGLGFPGGTYADVYYVADLQARGAVTNGELHAALDDADFLAIFPMRGQGRIRLVGAVRPEDQDAPVIRWEDVSGRIVERLGVTVDEVRWFSTYRVHHRVAGSFQRGRAFILGDAAHVHSPVGGQGMNTGIGDAVNLAWKLAAVLQRRADAAVLDTYESERIAFARTLVATTDRAFQFVSARGPLATRVRLTLVPKLLPSLFRLDVLRRLMFRTLSQTAIRYPQSPLSSGVAGRVRGGDRLPWIAAENPAEPAHDNFASLTSRDWQVHVYGSVSAEMQTLCDARRLALHAFPWRAAMSRTGLQENGAYLVRPDGYVGVANAAGDAATFERYLDEHHIRLP